MAREIEISYGLCNALIWKWGRFIQVYSITADTEREGRPPSCGLCLDGLYREMKTSSNKYQNNRSCWV